MKISTDMNTTIEYFQEMFKALIALLIAIITPVKSIIAFLIIAFIFDIIMGIRADKKINDVPFSLEKFSKSFRLLMFFSACILFISVSIVLLSEHEIGTISIRWLSLLLLWGYSLNIVKNAHLMHPESKVLSILYQILSTEIFDRLMLMVGIKK